MSISVYQMGNVLNCLSWFNCYLLGFQQENGFYSPLGETRTPKGMCLTFFYIFIEAFQKLRVFLYRRIKQGLILPEENEIHELKNK